MTDLVTLAENKLDAAITAEEGQQPPAGDDTPPAADDDQQPPAGGDQPPADDTNNDNPDEEPGDDDGQDDPDDSQEDQPPQGDEEDPDEGSEQEDDAGKPKGDEAPKELSDDELIAELEKRGLKVAKKDEEPADDKPKVPEFKKPAEVDDAVWGEMLPVQKYIYTELPYITVNGTDAEGNATTLRVKTYEQLPDGFNYTDKKEELRVNDAFNQQSRKAEEMYAKIQQNAQQQTQQSEQQRESKMIVEGIEQLQKDGVIPKIAAQHGTPEFDTDPGVIRANEIIKYRAELLKQGENVSIVSAGKMYKADHPELYVTKPTTSRGDAERKAKAKNISGGGRGTQQQAKKTEDQARRYPVGMSAAEIAEIAGRDLE